MNPADLIGKTMFVYIGGTGHAYLHDEVLSAEIDGNWVKLTGKHLHMHPLINHLDSVIVEFRDQKIRRQEVAVPEAARCSKKNSAGVHLGMFRGETCPECGEYIQ